MKNIHLLPTAQPSRLFKFANELHLDTIPKDYYKKYNIYITSDEDIKEDDWGLSKLNEVILFGRSYNEKFYNKIILTTDQDLIADGVQAIDDEFLEWFVKNPSCKYVEVDESKYFDGSHGEYIIIIPQEEPKQDPTLENSKLALREYILANKEKVTEDLQEMREKSDIGRDETLEEAAERISKTNSVYETAQDDFYHGFVDGAKWQAERMYSEEELKNAIEISVAKALGVMSFTINEESFEQFKKK
jgi:hypothetical protein